MTDTRCLRALVVDGGDPHNGARVRSLLSQAHDPGFDVAWTTMSSYLETAGRSSEHAPEILVLSLGPSVSGATEQLEGVRRLDPDLAIVVVADRVDAGSRALALRAGAEQVFAIDELSSRLFGVVVLQMVEQARAAASRERLETLLESSPSFIIALDVNGLIQYINHVLPPCAKANVIGKSWIDFVPEDRRATSRRLLGEVLRNGAPQTFETATLGPDGVELCFSSHIGPLQHGGKIAGAVVVAQDITDRKRASAELLSAQRMAAVGTLASGIAHEINTPIQFVSDSLVFVRGAVDDLFTLVGQFVDLHERVLADGPTEEAAAAYSRATEEADLAYVRENVPAAFERCVEGLGRVATIVRALKEFTHPSAEEMSPLDLNRAIQSTLTIARSEYKYIADLETRFGEIPPVTCHAGEINQVVLNLVINAAHAIQDVVQSSGKKGRIVVETALSGDDVAISISDTGTGIPEAIRSRIFDPFFTTKEVGKGTGQGLAIARTIVIEHHGGDISVDSRIGEGTTFLVKLPIGPASGAGAGVSLDG